MARKYEKETVRSRDAPRQHKSSRSEKTVAKVSRNRSPAPSRHQDKKPVKKIEVRPREYPSKVAKKVISKPKNEVKVAKKIIVVTKNKRPDSRKIPKPPAK